MRYRALYKTYRQDPDLQKLHEKHAMIATWDDQFANDTYYPEYEREMIAAAVKYGNIKNLIALTCDFHTFEASIIWTVLHSLGIPIRVELMVGSVTSTNLREAIRNNLTKRPDVSSTVPMPAVTELIDLLQEKMVGASTLTAELLFKELQNVVKVENPWIKLFESTSHGYAVLELTKEKATWTAYKVDSIETRNPNKELLWQCDVPKDKAELNVVQDKQRSE
ncbi:alkaline phosphatase D family protein [Bacillus sp. T33-2]|uniref:alkaline phosphatase D family protein n=1 Tax=Bacillus sp. T33-2 TaxID=2054168 RepID=UPI0015E14B95|nr:alkaline phosphatase D family protein [Bacillus sp. T33-2]